MPANGFGLGYGIDVAKVTDADAVQLLTEAAQKLGPGAADPKRLAATLVGDAAAPYHPLVEQQWQTQVLQARQ